MKVSNTRPMSADYDSSQGLKDMSWSKKTKMSRSRQKICVNCEETKEAHLCVPRLNICKKCRDDPDAYLVRVCSKCSEEKEWPKEFRGKVCRKCSYEPVIRKRSCTKCEQEKEVSSFAPRSVVCIECMEDPEVFVERECTKCNETKSLKDDFRKGSWICKKCQNKKQPVTRQCKGCGEIKKRAEYKKAQEYCLDCEGKGVSIEKTCRDCGETKSSDMFRPNRRKCTDCERSNGRNYRRVTTKAKEWAENNKERLTELQKDWYEANKPSIRERELKRMKEDPIFREIKNYRTCIGQFYRTKTKTSRDLATTKDNFLKWMEFSFEDGMTLENHRNGWHIDHVLPLELKFKYKPSEWCWKIIEEEDAFDCLYTWYNTFPLFPKDNRSKSQSIKGERLITHLKHLQEYIRQNKIQKDEHYFKYVNLVQKIVDASYNN